MCGRYVLFTPWAKLAALLEATLWTPDAGPRFNASPTQRLPVVMRPRGTGDQPVREMRAMSWGFRPAWAGGGEQGKRPLAPINARSETAATSPMFRSAMRATRCLVPMDGFYEWDQHPPEGESKRAFFIRFRDRRVMVMAGVWTPGDEGAADDTGSFAILTRSGNPVLEGVHERMPAILDMSDVAAWMDVERTSPTSAVELCREVDPELLERVQVSTRVNSPKNDGPELIEPIGSEAARGRVRTRPDGPGLFG